MDFTIVNYLNIISTIITVINKIIHLNIQKNKKLNLFSQFIFT